MHPEQVYKDSKSTPLDSSLQKPKLKDCLSCRLWGGIAHLGIAAFVASHYGQMHSRGARGFLLTFSSGNALLRAAAFFHQSKRENSGAVSAPVYLT